MTRIAADGGTVDKFIGDAMVIFFGDPHGLGVRETHSASRWRWP
jgi:class 3 adenylate cyclase